MILGISHIEIPSDNLLESLNFYTKYFDMVLIEEGNNFFVLEQGFIKFIILSKYSKEHFCSFRIEVASVSSIYNKILSENKSIKSIHKPLLRNNIEEAKITDCSGNFITLWRELSEDELETLPKIISAINWDVKAENTLNKLIKKVPIVFRKFARERVIKEAEYIAYQNNVNTITENICIEAYIVSTPDIMKNRVMQNLIENGIDIKLFEHLFN